MIVEYEDATEGLITDRTQMSTLMEHVPEPLKSHLQLNAERLSLTTVSPRQP